MLALADEVPTLLKLTGEALAGADSSVKEWRHPRSKTVRCLARYGTGWQCRVSIRCQTVEGSVALRWNGKNLGLGKIREI